MKKSRFMVLGAAFDWGERKGLDIFIELSRRLDKRFKIVLVGTNEQMDKNLPDHIISIHRTNDQKELARIFSAADIFVNPTREEVLGMTNIEALACGTPVITFRTGGSPECIDDTCGKAVAYNDIEMLADEIVHVCENQIFKQADCLERAGLFDYKKKMEEYLSLYG